MQERRTFYQREKETDETLTKYRENRCQSDACDVIGDYTVPSLGDSLCYTTLQFVALAFNNIHSWPLFVFENVDYQLLINCKRQQKLNNSKRRTISTVLTSLRFDF